MIQLIQRVIDMKLMIQWAVTSSALILIVLAVRYLFRNKLSARLKYALWGVVLLRLLAPFQIELPAAAPVPVLASNLAQDVTPRLDDTLLYAVPTEEQPYGLPAGMPPEYIRNGPFDSAWDRFSGGTVYDGEHITRYAFMMTALEVVVLIWLAGTALAALAILTSNLHFARRLRKRRKKLGLPDTPIPVYTVEGLPSPCLFGVFRPAVYVTPQAAEDPDTLRHVLAHELTHYAHRDHLWSLLRCLALALHWYDPLVWLAVVLSKQDGELACDEGAVARLGEEERIPYGRTLVDMVAARSLRPGDLLSCSTAMTGGGKSVKQRVAQLVKKPETVRTALFAAVALVALGLVFTFAGRASAEQGNTMLLSYLDRTTAIRYYPPTYSSTFYPDPIADPDPLAQAKESLSGFRYLEDGDPQPDLRETLHQSRIILTFEGGEMEYSLLWQNDHTYLFPGNILQECLNLKAEEGETAQLQGVSGTCISKQGDNVISVLEGLARLSTRKSRSGSLELDRFLSELESAQSIDVGQPMLFSADPPGLISDPAALARAKELLGKARGPFQLGQEISTEELFGIPRTAINVFDPEPVTITQELLEDMLFMRGSPIVLCPDTEVTPDAEYRYYLAQYKEGENSKLLRWDAELEEEPIKLLATYSEDVYSQLAELARTNGALRGYLTRAQVEQINEAFRDEVKLPDGGWGSSEISCFFTSSYDDPTQIDLEEFLAYCPLAEILENDEVEEFQAVIAKDGSWDDWEYGLDSPGDLPVPTKRYPREKVSALLQKYAGVTVDELDWSGCLYLEEYDAFYNFTSDFGPGFFPCTGGQIMEDTVLLWSDPDENGDRCELTLRKDGENWLIQSHHTIYER